VVSLDMSLVRALRLVEWAVVDRCVVDMEASVVELIMEVARTAIAAACQTILLGIVRLKP
jgi:hypothetical protein